MKDVTIVSYSFLLKLDKFACRVDISEASFGRRTWQKFFLKQFEFIKRRFHEKYS